MGDAYFIISIYKRYINSLEDFRKILAHKNPYCYLLLVTDDVCRASIVPPL